jgi:superfamily II DNA or RNA helicase
MPQQHPRRHSRASVYAKSGLFKDLSQFSDLELRIEQLATEQERGAAFEVFVEAYLNVNQIVQADEVWVCGCVPREISRRINLSARDYGYDGVFRTRLGELVAYQAKFRSGRASLSWRELGTFFGITEKADRRVVLTNAIGISEVAQSRTNFQTTRGGDFDRLDVHELAAIAAWVEGKPRRQKRDPRLHQIDVLADIRRELVDHDRATVVMACGTGKTLVALWAAEQAHAKRVLVLVPSLSLLRQTLHEWAQSTSWADRFRYLCVCSDSTVAAQIDEIEMRPEDLDFPVSTESAIVAQFLRTAPADAVSVIFCTYQSAHVIGKAIQGGQPFDLGIFDEAHKTTGWESTRFAFALKDKNLPIRKRLFLTATPRHYLLGQRNKEGDLKTISMDDQGVYGRVAHRLTFGRAAEQGIIVPYKVVISVVDSEMISNAVMDRSEVDVNGDPVRAKWVAHQIALKRAIEKHDLKRVITFHTSVKAAKAFASSRTEGIGFHLSNFKLFHVSGEQPTAEREEWMREFEQSTRAIVTNARCLTEGVDVPSVDMVAFMNPRKSRVDIVQAVGRAMRTTNDSTKTCGYVLVPLFLEKRKGESENEAVGRSDFGEVAEVLNALQETDEVLNDVIKELNVERGKIGGFDERRLLDKVEVLGPRINLAELATSIYTRIVREIGVTWDMRYGELIAHKELTGICNVPIGRNTPLAVWCQVQRQNYKRERLSPDRIQRLSEIGFDFDPLTSWWEEMFTELGNYKQKVGHCKVPVKGAHASLHSWCAKQRKRRKEGTLSTERIERLDSIGFVWTVEKLSWEENVVELAAYKKEFGHCNVPVNSSDLGKWCSKQRTLYRKNTLTSEQIERLNALGFAWAIDQGRTDTGTMLAALSAYRDKHGHSAVQNQWKDDRKLAKWCNRQRMKYKQGKLPSDLFEKLTALDFPWQARETGWQRKFAKLVAYKQRMGDCKVPVHWKEDRQFGMWCRMQKTRYRIGKLAPERVEQLTALGFEFGARRRGPRVRG